MTCLLSARTLRTCKKPIRLLRLLLEKFFVSIKIIKPFVFREMRRNHEITNFGIRSFDRFLYAFSVRIIVSNSSIRHFFCDPRKAGIDTVISWQIVGHQFIESIIVRYLFVRKYFVGKFQQHIFENIIDLKLLLNDLLQTEINSLESSAIIYLKRFICMRILTKILVLLDFSFPNNSNVAFLSFFVASVTSVLNQSNGIERR